MVLCTTSPQYGQASILKEEEEKEPLVERVKLSSVHQPALSDAGETSPSHENEKAKDTLANRERK